MDEHVILRTVVRMLVPFILMFGLYIQFHGELSPGGGFQAGVICAAAFIAYGFIYDLEETMRIVPFWFVRMGSALGVLIYAGVGIITIINGGHFLGYNELSVFPVHGQERGIFWVEIGVGLTVFSVMMVVFYVFAERSS